MNIGLIDYGAGNLRSVANALKALGFTPTLVNDAGDIPGLSHVVLPGVGSFGDCMAELERRGLVDPLRAWIRAGKPYLGFCLGYQVLFEDSEESPGIAGLGVMRGSVTRFPASPEWKIPHMGWNSALPLRPDAGVWSGLGSEPYFYFVHSYAPVPQNASNISARTSYAGIDFASAVEAPALFACQFHPEKSQGAGLTLIRNFLEQNPA